MSSARHERDPISASEESNTLQTTKIGMAKPEPMEVQQPATGVAARTGGTIEGCATAPTDRGTVSRTITVEISGSLTKLASDGSQARWGVDKNANAVFQPTSTDKGYSDIAGQCDIGNAVLHSMKLTEVRSTFPCTLGIDIAGVSGQHATRDGVKYAIVVQKDTKHHVNKQLVSPDEMTNSEYLKKYPGMTPDKIAKEGIVRVPGEEYVFVDSQHPIVEMLCVNQDVLQVNMSAAELIDGRWYKVSSDVVTDCTKLLDQQLLQHLPIVDLSDFKVNVERVGKVPWDRLDNIADDLQGQSNMDPLVERMMTRMNTVSLEIELEYSFM